MIQEIKDIRVRIDGLAFLVKNLKGYSLPQTTYLENLETGKGDFHLSNVQTNSHFINQSEDCLLLSKMWLGKVLESLESNNPYGSGYKTKEDIVPTQDVSEIKLGMYNPTTGESTTKSPYIDTFELNGVNMSFYMNKNYIEKVDWLRTEIQDIIQKTHVMRDNFSYNTQNDKVNWEKVYSSLTEAKMWLGSELKVIKEEK